MTAPITPSQGGRKHTPTPWRNACFQVYGADNSRVAHTGMGQLPPPRSAESEANAEFIVEACSSHATLKARIEDLEAALKPFADISLVRDTDPNGVDMIDAPDLAITPNDVRRTRALLASKGGVK